jgi:hypothetical protein
VDYNFLKTEVGMKLSGRWILSALVFLLLITLVIPLPAVAGIDSHNWLGAAYEGNDAYFGTNVVAYEEGTPATLVVRIDNTTGSNITVQSASLEFDWYGGAYQSSNYPTNAVENGKGAGVFFDFTVPSATTAGEKTTHNYDITVRYKTDAQAPIRQTVQNEVVATANGVTSVFYLDHHPVAPGSPIIYVNSVAVTAYTLNLATGMITFSSAPTAGSVITASYQYIEEVGTADGVNTVFTLDHYPMSGTILMYVNGVATTDYTVDADEKKVTFNSAPAAGSVITADYDYYYKWTDNGDNFVVYPTSQAEAEKLQREITALGTLSVVTAKARELSTLGQADASLGDQEYSKGNFTEAKLYYETALENLKDALSVDRDEAGYVPIFPWGTFLHGVGWTLLGIGVILYALRRLVSR